VSSTIDDARLPNRIVVDTSVLLGALAPSTTTSETEACAALFEAMGRGHRRILIPATVLAEYYRGPNGGEPRSFPRAQNLVVVDFNERAARYLARHLASVARQYGPRWLFVPDAQGIAVAIVCAEQDQSTAFVTTDGAQLRRARKAGLDARRPVEFLSDYQDPTSPQPDLYKRQIPTEHET
jgi:predicted nucleic acid-binding protein